MSILKIRLLGPPKALLDGEPVKFDTRKALAMLAYLAVEGTVTSREALTGHFWPESDPERARSSFRRTLSNLRSGLQGDWVVADREQVELSDESGYLLDTDLLEAVPSLPQAHDHSSALICDRCQTELSEAVEAYHGEFMQGFSLADSPGFDEWQTLHREHFHQLYLTALSRLSDGHTSAGEYEQAILAAEQVLQHDPLHEPTRCRLMKLHYWNGDRPRALQVYEQWEQQLEEELQVPPMEETQELAQRIRSGELSPPTSPRVSSEQEASSAEPRNPYRGLLPFRERDADVFFGREAFVRRLLEALELHAFCALIGPSGSGKSSVSRAGLVAALHEQGQWNIQLIRPGPEPQAALDSALASLTSGPDEGSLLLVVDQFEEIYTLTSDAGTRRAFVDKLLAFAGSGVEDVVGTRRVVITLRADFLGQALAYRPLADALQDSDIKLGPMTRSELERALKLPAHQREVSFEPGLVDRILNDLARAPGHLPLLQFALTSLWDARTGGDLRHSDYEALGGVAGALAQYAEQTYSELSAGEKESARRALLQMVRPGEGTEDTRRIATRRELTDHWEVVRKLADARLVVTGRGFSDQPTAEVAHEALIQGWDRLQRWLEADRAFRLWQERLRASLAQWQQTDRDEGALLRGAPLNEAATWLNERAEDLAERERHFIEESLAGRRARRRARRKRRRRTLLALGAGLALTMLLAALAVVQWRQAAQERDASRASRSRQLAVQALSSLSTQADLALLLSVEAARLAETETAVEALTTALEETQGLRFLRGSTEPANEIVFSQTSDSLYAVSPRGGVTRWDVGSEPSGRRLEQCGETGFSLAVGPEGERIAVGDQDGGLRLCDSKSGGILADRPDAHPGTVISVRFVDVDNALVAVSCRTDLFEQACVSLEIRRWSLPELDPASTPISVEFGAPIRAGDVKVEHDLLVVGDLSGRFHIWSLSTGDQRQPAKIAHPGGVAYMEIDPTGQILATGGSDGDLRLWDIQEGEPLHPPLRAHQHRISALAFDPEGRSLLSTDIQGTTLLWTDLAADPASQNIGGHAEGVTAAAFSSDGELAALSHTDGVLTLHEVAERSGGQEAVQLLTGDATSLSVSEDGSTIAVGRSDGNVETLFLSEPALASSEGLEWRTLTSHDDSGIRSVAISTELDRIAAATFEGEILVWDLTSAGDPTLVGEVDGEVLSLGFADERDELITSTQTELQRWDLARAVPIGEPVELPEGRYFSPPQLSPDGDLAAIGTNAGPVDVWEVQAGRRLYKDLPGPSLPIASFAFHPHRPLLAGGGCAEGNLATQQCQRGEVRFWELDTGEPHGDPLLGNPGGVNAVTYTDDGELLLAGDALPLAGNVLVWRTGDETIMSELQDLPAQVLHAAFVLDEETALIRTNDLNILIWRISRSGQISAQQPDTLTLERQVELACQRADRNLTEREWERYFPGEPYQWTCPQFE